MRPFDVPAACPGWVVTVLLLTPPVALLFGPRAFNAVDRYRQRRAEWAAHRSFAAQRDALAAAIAARSPGRSGDPSPHPRTRKRAAA